MHTHAQNSHHAAGLMIASYAHRLDSLIYCTPMISRRHFHCGVDGAVLACLRSLSSSEALDRICRPMRSSVKMPRVVPAKYAEIVTTAAAKAIVQVCKIVVPARDCVKVSS